MEDSVVLSFSWNRYGKHESHLFSFFEYHPLTQSFSFMSVWSGKFDRQTPAGGLFPLSVWSECHRWTGKFLCVSSFTLAVNVIGKKQYIGISIAALIVSPIIFEIYMALDTSALFLTVSFALSDELTPNDAPEFVYYMNDGVYGSFMGKLFGNIITTPSVHKVNHTCTIFQ